MFSNQDFAALIAVGLFLAAIAVWLPIMEALTW